MKKRMTKAKEFKHGNYKITMRMGMYNLLKKLNLINAKNWSEEYVD
jgi:cell division protein YceG involved in septum cleavage